MGLEMKFEAGSDFRRRRHSPLPGVFRLKINAEVRVELVVGINLVQELKSLRAGTQWQRGQHNR